MDSLSSLLGKIGCSPAEATTFVALHGCEGGASAIQLGKLLGLPRATIYGHLDTLISLGLAKRAAVGNGSIFLPEPPQRIAALFSEKADELEMARLAIERALTLQHTAPNHTPRLFVYDQGNAAELVFRDVLRSQEKQSSWFWPPKEMVKSIPSETLRHFHSERVARGMRLRVLWPRDQQVNLRAHPELLGDKGNKALRDVRILPSHMPALLGYGIFGSQVGFIGTRRERFGFVVESPDLSATLQAQFDFLWKLAKPIR